MPTGRKKVEIPHTPRTRAARVQSTQKGGSRGKATGDRPRKVERELPLEASRNRGFELTSKKKDKNGSETRSAEKGIQREIGAGVKSGPKTICSAYKTATEYFVYQQDPGKQECG